MKAVSRRASSLVLLLLGAAAAAVGCSSGEASDDESTEGAATVGDLKALLDVNDVSILFARTSNGDVLPNISVTESVGAGGSFWNQRDFDNLMTFAKGDAEVDFRNGGDKIESWRIFSMRFDPCAPTFKTQTPDAELRKQMAIAEINECVAQIRLIAQPVRADGNTKDQDIAAHLVYTLAPFSQAGSTIEEMVTDLQAIKKASEGANAPTTGETLGVHPGLKLEASKGAGRVSELVKSFVFKYTAKSVARTVAFMGLGNDGFEPWIFFAGKITADGWQKKPSLSFINPDAPDPSKFVFSQKLSFIDAEQVIPAPIQRTSTAPLFKNSTDASLAFGVENPSSAHVLNTDCVSCHSSSSRVLSLGLKTNGTRVKAPRGLTGFIKRADAQGSTWNVRNFGYFNGKPTVSHRTLNESVAVAEFVNTSVLKSTVPGPARDCTAKDDSVWQCFIDGKEDCTSVCGDMLSKTEAPATPDSEPKPIDPAPSNPTRQDPCSVVSAKNVALTATGAELTDENAACLSRSLNGSYTSGAVDISCAASTRCVITLKGASADPAALREATVKKADAKRLNDVLLVAKSSGGKRYRSTGPAADGGFVGITCTGGTFKKDQCTVTTSPTAIAK